ncbi:MAG: Lrp/AsnC family transcriptional regulator [Steroidobacteraceae bacterium]|nr:Lrp/AsnC family transcriptional regulator [Pseudomonadota bacterium]MBP6105329.1 Lrp/AsnC family transcriptional regulator [Steroidobacteraceae bacterium]MBP7012878.1 Lrp/AsnC family transcriptional regulator [Steroidobacteraceae bacterium]
MDDLDRQLIGLLRGNARLPAATIARTLRVARGTVQNRIARLEQAGVIVGYTVRLAASGEARRITALTMIAVEGNNAEKVLRSLRGDASVSALHTTNGRWDVIAELRADTLEEFDRVLSRIRRIEGVANSETNLLLSTHKY